MKCNPSNIFLLFVTIAYCGLSQSNFKITGRVLDSTNTPIDNAIVSLIKANNGALLKTTFTEKEGSFDFVGLSADSFKISVSQLGYHSFVSEIIVLDSSHQTHQLPDIIFNSNSKN